MNTPLRVLGVIEAGFPSSASEELVDTMSLDEYLLGNKEATYLLNVRTNSMSESGILQGDMVIVERGKDPKRGDIVIVEEDGSYSMTHFSDIPKKFNSEAIVSAVVTAVVRKYGHN
jgi:SOS-response transcriptional repressor LexA